MNKMMLALILMALSVSVSGQDVDEELSARRANYQINNYFKAGSYLIYDCWRGYYTCVDEDSFNKCKEMRKEAMDKKLKEYPCAHLNKFPTKTACAKKNYEVVEAVAKKRFCYPKN